MEFGMDLEQFNEIRENNANELVPGFARMEGMQEFAPSMEVQAAEILDVYRDIPELHFDKWKELDVEQKVNVLNSFEQRIAEIEMRDAMPVEHEATKPALMGYYDGSKLVISDNLLTSSQYEDYKQAMDTLFHEGRHAYQNYNLNICQTESSNELVNSWRVNLQELGYDSPGGINSLFSNKGYYRYYTQPIEVDARLFAETVVNRLGI